MEDFRGTRSYSCTRMILCCSHIPHFHHTPSQFYIRWYLQAKLDIWTIGLIEWQAVKFPLNLLNFAEEKNTIGPSGEPHMTLTSRWLLSSLELYHEVTIERIITEYKSKERSSQVDCDFRNCTEEAGKNSGIDGGKSDGSKSGGFSPPAKWIICIYHWDYDSFPFLIKNHISFSHS